MRARTLSIGMQSDGDGTHPVTALLSYIVAEQKNRTVLAVDFNPAGTLTRMLTLANEHDFAGKSTLEAVKAMNPIPFIHKISKNLDLLPAEKLLFSLSTYLYTAKQEVNPSFLLAETLEKVKNDYEWIVIDLPPTPGDLVTNGLVASDYILSVLRTDHSGYRALRTFAESIIAVQETLNPNLQIVGIVPLVDKPVCADADRAILETARREYGELLFNTILYDNSRINEWIESGIEYRIGNQQDQQALRGYLELLDEMI